MYECQSCGHRFETPKEHNEWHEVGSARFPEAVLGCPRCGGGYIELPEAEPVKDKDEENTEEAEVVNVRIHRHAHEIEQLALLVDIVSLLLEELPFDQLIVALSAIINHRVESEGIDFDESISAIMNKAMEA